jgi:sugar transferase (PEP-CTERM/EpsH1 system associated)
MAERASAPQRWIYAREARTLLAFERRATAAADQTLLSSTAEVELFLRRAPEAAARISAMGNGVDLDYFSPRHVFPPPFGTDRPAIVFTGAMGYWPNVEAVTWFAREVMPRLAGRAKPPVFVVVGSNPAEPVTRLAGPDIVVTGRVADVRPYLAHAAVVVAPLRLARGVQNKVLEGMAMGKIVIATGAAEQGLGVRDENALLIADTADAMTLRIVETLDGRHDTLGRTARATAEARFGWPTALRRLDRVFAGREDETRPTGLGQEKVA